MESNSMPFMSAKDAASHWGISQRRVAYLCSEGRVPNATILGNMWLIPRNSNKPIDARNTCEKKVLAKPFIKWAGGKGQLLPELSKRLPEGFGKSIKKYAEPFVGGGAFLFELLQKYHFNDVFISDNNSALITLYTQIQSNVDDLIYILDDLEKEFLRLSQQERKEYFYLKRKRFNDINSKKVFKTENAALFLFLNKTCFNGLYRVNRKGEYNVPMGDYKNPKIYEKHNLKRASDLLKNVTIIAGDYRNSECFIDENTFVYFDPPYRPLTKTSNFTAYTEGDFNDNHQKELAQYITKISSKGAKIMLSNSDPKNIDISDNFFDDLYENFKIRRVLANRMINSNAAKRGRVTELLITNY